MKGGPCVLTSRLWGLSQGARRDHSGTSRKLIAISMKCNRWWAAAVALAIVTACGGTNSASPSPAALVSIGDGLHGPAGLHASVFARGLIHAAALAFDPQGRLWVATAAYDYTGDDGVYVVADAGATPVEVITGLRTPLGLLWYAGSLYVASTSRVDAYSDFNGTRFLAHRTVLILPAGSGEVNELVLAPDGRMLMGITAPCDHCTPVLAVSGSIVSFLPDGSGLTEFATRIRAPVGLEFYPGTDDLFVTMNQRDDLGARTPGDWLAVVREGQSWGFPACYGQGSSVCAGVPAPVAVLDKHAAVSGVAIVTGQLGPAVGTKALVAEWAKGVVDAVTLTHVGTGYTGTVVKFITGLKSPVPVILGPDNAIYVGDWGAGIVYRVAASG
jgi:glucose/arabinose dehydrogenase